MSAYLLDVNVLIALVDPLHVQHDSAHRWFGQRGKKAFATCPITENGLLRIVGDARYPNSPGTPGIVAASLAAIRALPGHRFWPDAISICDDAQVFVSRLARHSHVTDTYLLALARSQGGKLASMDRRLATEAVAGGADAFELIPTSAQAGDH